MSDFDDFDAPWTDHRDELYSRVVKRGRALQWQRRSAAFAIVAVVLAIPVGAFAVSTSESNSVQTQSPTTSLPGYGTGTTSTSTTTTTTTTIPGSPGSHGGKGGGTGPGGGVTTTVPTPPTSIPVSPPRAQATDITGTVTPAADTVYPNVPNVANVATIVLTNTTDHTIRLLGDGDTLRAVLTGGRCCADAHPATNAAGPVDLDAGASVTFVVDISPLWVAPGQDSNDGTAFIHLSVQDALGTTILDMPNVSDVKVTLGADPNATTTSVAG